LKGNLVENEIGVKGSKKSRELVFLEERLKKNAKKKPYFRLKLSPDV
jgi:hypothetical protein